MTMPARPLATRPRPQFFTIGDGHYLLDAEGGKCYLEVARVSRDRNGDLRAALDVRTTLAGAMELDSEGTIARFESANLSQLYRRREMAQDITRRARAKDIDWLALLDDLAFQVGKAEAVGAPAEWLGDIARVNTDPIFTVEGLPLLANHPQILFGDGDSLKSYLALWIAGRLAVQGVRVMFADWELDGGDHRERGAQMWGADLPPVLYVRCNRPLVHEIDRLARIKHIHGVQFAILDSVTFACHAKPEDALTAQEYFRALRSLRIGTLNLAHTTKAGDFAEHRPFGSAFWHNGARATWFAKAEDESQDSKSRTVILQNRKSNLGSRRSALAYRFEFEPNIARVSRTDAAAVESLVHTLPAWQRIKSAVASGPLSFAEIAEETGIKEDTIRKTVARRDGMFRIFEGANGAKKVALLERRAS